MSDPVEKSKRSEVMRAVRSSGNKRDGDADTPLNAIPILCSWMIGRPLLGAVQVGYRPFRAGTVDKRPRRSNNVYCQNGMLKKRGKR